MKSLIFAAILSLFFVGTANGDEPSSRSSTNYNYGNGLSSQTIRNNPFPRGVGKQQWQKPQPQSPQPTAFRFNSNTNYNYRTNNHPQRVYYPRGYYQYNYRPVVIQFYPNSYYYSANRNYYYYNNGYEGVHNFFFGILRW
mgnify:FL=1